MDCLKLLIETPLCYPRFMFQTLQTTSIKVIEIVIDFGNEKF